MPPRITSGIGIDEGPDASTFGATSEPLPLPSLPEPLEPEPLEPDPFDPPVPPDPPPEPPEPLEPVQGFFEPFWGVGSQPPSARLPESAAWSAREMTSSASA